MFLTLLFLTFLVSAKNKNLKTEDLETHKSKSLQIVRSVSAKRAKRTRLVYKAKFFLLRLSVRRRRNRLLLCQ